MRDTTRTKKNVTDEIKMYICPECGAISDTVQYIKKQMRDARCHFIGNGVDTHHCVNCDAELFEPIEEYRVDVRSIENEPDGTGVPYVSVNDLSRIFEYHEKMKTDKVPPRSPYDWKLLNTNKMQ